MQTTNEMLEKAIENLDAIDGADAEFSLDQTIALAAAYAAVALVQVQEQSVMHLSNIHQCLITPDSEGQPVSVADSLATVALHTEAINGVIEMLTHLTNEIEAINKTLTKWANRYNEVNSQPKGI